MIRSPGSKLKPSHGPTQLQPVTGDPKNDYLVALYRDAKADLLVSGDSDLQAVDAADVTVITRGELLERL